jgi:hypothetical protein
LALSNTLHDRVNAAITRLTPKFDVPGEKASAVNARARARRIFAYFMVIVIDFLDQVTFDAVIGCGRIELIKR